MQYAEFEKSSSNLRSPTQLRNLTAAKIPMVPHTLLRMDKPQTTPMALALMRLSDFARRSGVGADMLEGAIHRRETPSGVKLRLIGFAQVRFITRPELLMAWLTGDDPPADDCVDHFQSEASTP